MSVLDVALIGCAVSFLMAIVRAGIGPTLADRAAATDVCLFILVASLGILAVRAPALAYVDVVLVTTLLGFIATIALANLVMQGRGRPGPPPRRPRRQS